ncbi:propionyl-CoA synthetase [Ancylobacter lacus]|uniref:propionyl-CoA synthetase n=1 Tax=Ancylobacter lacus TaxID=2579970 RepID=UPI001BCD8D22|nr:propionyl-CoA synthetase [Ancylobacter lacus]MBS7541477.1 propionyl-CoA synthetase [Ancylobacter lacus]
MTISATPSAEAAYRAVHARSLADPQGFWGEAARAVEWIAEPRAVFDPSLGAYGRWFVGGICNVCHNAVDRHVNEGRGQQAAILYDSPVTGTRRRITYSELLGEVRTLAGTLRDLGVEKGDRVVIYMPMVPEAVFAMLACARIGAVHSVVFGGFAAAELAARIDDAQPKVVLSASCGIEPSRIVAYKPLLDHALELAHHTPERCLILQRPELEAAMVPGRDIDWATLRGSAYAGSRGVECAPVGATDPLYILYTSGTTGKPKGVVRDTAGYMVALRWSMEWLYGMKPGEVFWSASDIGWVVGHSYIVYGPLLAGCTTVLYEGKPVGTPDAGAFWRVVAEYGVGVLFTAPTALRVIKKEDPQALRMRDHDLSSLRALFLAGERADPDTVRWIEDKLKVPVVDHWWQTETGWAIAGNPLGIGALEVQAGSTGVPMPGYRVEVLDEAGHPVEPGRTGSVAIGLPLPPGCLPTLWHQPERFAEGYLTEFPGYYKTADAGVIDKDGRLTIVGRTDDIINVAGHRLSTGEMEEVLAALPDVAECAVIGVHDAIKGEVPCGFLVLKSGVDKPAAQVEREAVAQVREQIGPVAAFRLALVVGRLPKTRSGKILRGTMKKIADQDDWTRPATIEDPAVLDEIAETPRARGVSGEKLDA